MVVFDHMAARVGLIDRFTSQLGWADRYAIAGCTEMQQSNSFLEVSNRTLLRLSWKYD